MKGREGGRQEERKGEDQEGMEGWRGREQGWEERRWEREREIKGKDLEQRLAHEVFERDSSLYHVLQQVALDAIALLWRELVPIAQGCLLEHDRGMEAGVFALRIGNNKLRHVDGIFGAAQPDHKTLGLSTLRTNPRAAQLARRLNLRKLLHRQLRHRCSTQLGAQTTIDNKLCPYFVHNPT